ncbi:MAG: CHRD domain-containing protein [bacterium]
MKNAICISVVITFALLFTAPASAQQYFQASINGAQEVPPTASPATGLGCFTLNTDNTLDYQVSYTGLLGVETGAHIHGPAPIGVNAAAVFPFALGTPKAGTFGPLTAQQASDLSNGLYYVNIHTTVFASGEIRGQILTSGSPCSVPTEHTTWGAIRALYQ